VTQAHKEIPPAAAITDAVPIMMMPKRDPAGTPKKDRVAANTLVQMASPVASSAASSASAAASSSFPRAASSAASSAGDSDDMFSEASDMNDASSATTGRYVPAVSSEEAARLATHWEVMEYIAPYMVKLRLTGLPDGLPDMVVLTRWQSLHDGGAETPEWAAIRAGRGVWALVRRVRRGNGERGTMPQYASVYEASPAAVQYIKHHLRRVVMQAMVAKYNATHANAPAIPWNETVHGANCITVEWTADTQHRLIRQFEAKVEASANTAAAPASKKARTQSK
jgi:hypothetical protein